MAVTETVTESWGSRLGSSFKGVLGGLLAFLLGFPVLFWNEGNSVKTAKALDEGEAACVEVGSNATVDQANDGKLVHMTGLADTKDVLEDGTFGVKATAIKLARRVEMYQWIEDSKTEEKKKLGGSVEKVTKYTYRQGWVSSLIDSSGFKEQGHQNPSAMEFSDEDQKAANVTFGAFRLNETQVDSIGRRQAYAFPADFTCRVERVQREGTTIYVPNAETRSNVLNNRRVSAQPRIGDMKVTFEVVYPHDISIVAKQQGSTFVKYIAKTKKSISLVADGVKSAEEMFESARQGNAILTWILRIVGFLLMFQGIKAVLRPISVLGDVLPILGNILEIGVGIVAFAVAAPCALVTIGIAWLFYRPVLGILLLAAAGAIVFWLVSKRKKIASVVAPAVASAAAPAAAAESAPKPPEA